MPLKLSPSFCTTYKVLPKHIALLSPNYIKSHWNPLAKIMPLLLICIKHLQLWEIFLPLCSLFQLNSVKTPASTAYPGTVQLLTARANKTLPYCLHCSYKKEILFSNATFALTTQHPELNLKKLHARTSFNNFGV